MSNHEVFSKVVSIPLPHVFMKELPDGLKLKSLKWSLYRYQMHRNYTYRTFRDFCRTKEKYSGRATESNR
ncbi:hypothetical protein CDAR_497461 [Caerostris darwini]|uniref:Uncharacterized protein n=1 Tax=Caerostris darwini TaxID=1538125 RepID=A0AAV4S1N8_9ARAC|nr:hypothetical protein CDAR_497461 [Caerostris darwini]